MTTQLKFLKKIIVPKQQLAAFEEKLSYKANRIISKKLLLQTDEGDIPKPLSYELELLRPVWVQDFK